MDAEPGASDQRRADDSTSVAWQRVLLARHPKRPHTLDYVERLFTDFHEIHGDRSFADDPAIVCGMAFFEGRPVMLVGEQKGRDTKQKLHRNFGMPKPEGYRKAIRVMQIAAKFERPIVTFLDTPGAYPGIDAEERGQAEAIARNLREMARLRTPVIALVIGEGGSGGALALGVGNQVFMMENAVYSVISPESCAAIIWRDSAKAELAASTDLPLQGQVFVSVREEDKCELEPIARGLHEMGFRLIATRGTARHIKGLGIPCAEINKVNQGSPHVVDCMKASEIALVINTPDAAGTADSFSIRRTALDMRLPYCTTMAGAQAAVEGIRALKTQPFEVKALQDYHPRSG